MAKIERYAAKGVWDPPTYSQGVKVTGAQTILYLAGQVAYDDKGGPAHRGDFKGQARAVFQALKAQVEAGGGTMDNVVKINTYFVTLFAKFLDKLQSTPDGDGSLLDHSMIFYGAGMGNPNGHLSDPLPVIVVGGSVGRGHRHLKLSERTQVGNLWLTVANKFGNSMESFGESTGTIDLF